MVKHAPASDRLSVLFGGSPDSELVWSIALFPPTSSHSHSTAPSRHLPPSPSPLPAIPGAESDGDPSLQPGGANESQPSNLRSASTEDLQRQQLQGGAAAAGEGPQPGDASAWSTGFPPSPNASSTSPGKVGGEVVRQPTHHTFLPSPLSACPISCTIQVVSHSASTLFPHLLPSCPSLSLPRRRCSTVSSDHGSECSCPIPPPPLTPPPAPPPLPCGPPAPPPAAPAATARSTEPTAPRRVPPTPSPPRLRRSHPTAGAACRQTSRRLPTRRRPSPRHRRPALQRPPAALLLLCWQAWDSS